MRGMLRKLVRHPPTAAAVRGAMRAILLTEHARSLDSPTFQPDRIRPGFAKLGVKLTPDQAEGVMLSALRLTAKDSFHDLEELCEALCKALKGEQATGAIELFGVADQAGDGDASLGTFLQQVPLFAKLDELEFQRLSETCTKTERLCTRGELIVSQGDVDDQMYLLISGEAVASVPSETLGRKPTVLRTYYRGDYFGDKDRQRGANVTVSSDKAICVSISAKDYQTLVGDSARGAGTESVASWRQQVSEMNAIEAWRTAVRRYLWLDRLHEEITDIQSMHGGHRRAKTDEDIRLEIAARRFFFAPDGDFITRYQLLQVLVLIFTAIVIPLRASFGQIDFEHPRFWFGFDIVYDLYFYFDIVINFRTAYFSSDQRLVHDSWSVAKNYFMGWFLVDFASVLPVSYILYIAESTPLPWLADRGTGSEAHDIQSSGASLKLLKILRLFRLTKMLKLLRMKNLLALHREHDLIARFMESVTIVRLFVQLLYITHFLACFFYLFGDITESSRPDGTVVIGWVREMESWEGYGWTGRYLQAFFLSVTDTAGAYAHTNIEMLWVGMQHIVYEAFMAYLTGVFAGEVISGNVGKQETTRKMEQVKFFMQQHHLPFHLRMQVFAFYQHLNSTKTVFDEVTILKEFPPTIRKKVIYEMYANIVDSRLVQIHYPFLSRLAERLRYELCLVLKPLPAMRGDVIYSEGEYGDEMYLVDSGACQGYKWTGSATGAARIPEHEKLISGVNLLTEGQTLHVRGIGGDTEAPGVYESVFALKEIFSQYGTFVDAMIRHRVDAETRKNTSYALVTMGDIESADRALAATVTRPDGRELTVTAYNSKTAAGSTGAMNRTRTAVLAMDTLVNELKEEELDEFETMHHKEYGDFISHFNDGSFFGEEALLGDNIKRLTTVVATATPSKILYLDRSAANSFSRREDVELFYAELRSFARKRRKFTELREKRAAQLDSRLTQLKRQFSISKLLAKDQEMFYGSFSRIPTVDELPMINAAFAPLTLPEVRDAVRFRCLAQDFTVGQNFDTSKERARSQRASGVDPSSSQESQPEAGGSDHVGGLLSGVFILLSGEIKATVADNIFTLLADETAADATRKAGTTVGGGAARWGKLRSRQRKGHTWRVLQPGAVFSGTPAVKKVKKSDGDEKKGEPPHAAGLRISSAEVSSATATTLWLDLTLFEFAHEPSSMETTISAMDSDDESSDDEHDNDIYQPEPTTRSATGNDDAPSAQALADVHTRLDVQQQVLAKQQSTLDEVKSLLQQVLQQQPPRQQELSPDTVVSEGQPPRQPTTTGWPASDQ